MSRFVRLLLRWLGVDPTAARAAKLSRNDPCRCGSGIIVKETDFPPMIRYHNGGPAVPGMRALQKFLNRMPVYSSGSTASPGRRHPMRSDALQVTTSSAIREQSGSRLWMLHQRRSELQPISTIGSHPNLEEGS